MDDSDVWIEKAAIAELITRYAGLNDRGDWDALAAMYTEEGRMNRPTAPDEFIVVPAAILAAFKARPRREARHIVANVVVTVEKPAHARATSQILLYTASPARDGGLPIQSTLPPLLGTYEDRLVKSEEGWRFVERRGRMDFQRPE